MIAYFESDGPRSLLTTTTTMTTSMPRNFSSKFKSGRRGRFCQKIVEIEAVLANLQPLEAEFAAEIAFLDEFSNRP